MRVEYCGMLWDHWHITTVSWCYVWMFKFQYDSSLHIEQRNTQTALKTTVKKKKENNLKYFQVSTLLFESGRDWWTSGETQCCSFYRSTVCECVTTKLFWHYVQVAQWHFTPNYLANVSDILGVSAYADIEQMDWLIKAAFSQSILELSNLMNDTEHI